MKTQEEIQLRLKPSENGERIKLSMRGWLSSKQTPQTRRRLLALMKEVARPARLDVVFSADASDNWAWCQPWTEALDDVPTGFSVRFAVRGGRHARR